MNQPPAESGGDQHECGIARNSTQPGERHIHLRIGIHVGDVVHREADMYGDGVNIGARIEPLAIGGAICLSDTVYPQVRNKVAVGLTKLDSPDLKHIEVPMDVYRVVLPWEKPGSSRREEAHSERGRRTKGLVTSAAPKWAAIATSVNMMAASLRCSVFSDGTSALKQIGPGRKQKSLQGAPSRTWIGQATDGSARSILNELPTLEITCTLLH